MVSSSSKTLSGSDVAGDGGTMVILGGITSGLGERAASLCRSDHDDERRNVDDGSTTS